MAYRQDQTHTTADFSRMTSPSSFFERRVCYQRQPGGYRRIETTIEVIETMITFDTTDDDQLVEDDFSNIDTNIEDFRATVQNLDELLVEIREVAEGIHQTLLEHNMRVQAHILELRELTQSPQHYNNVDNNDKNNNNLQAPDQRPPDSKQEIDTSSEELVYLSYTFSSEASDESWSSGVSDGCEDSSSSGSSDDSGEDSSSSMSGF